LLKNSNNIGSGSVTIKDDFRVLRVGKILRKTKFNELPQSVNIFDGDMSIISARPLHLKQFSFYSEDDQKVITSTRPGLSGVGSIIFRDEEKILQSCISTDAAYKEQITPRKAPLESWYIENKSIGLYYKLIVLTLIAVIFSNADMKKVFKDI